METSLKTGFAQVFSCCPKNLSCPNFGGAAAPLASPVRTPMSKGKALTQLKVNQGWIFYLAHLEESLRLLVKLNVMRWKDPPSWCNKFGSRCFQVSAAKKKNSVIFLINDLLWSPEH